MCSSGSLQGVLAGSHYNRAWVVHTAFSEDLERLFYERFLEEYNDTLPQIFSQLTDNTYINIETTIENEKDLFFEYLIFKDNVRSGTLGKTPQFWLQLYMDLMECQTRIHLAVQENDFDSRHAAWKSFLLTLYGPSTQYCALWFFKSVRKTERARELWFAVLKR